MKNNIQSLTQFLVYSVTTLFLSLATASLATAQVNPVNQKASSKEYDITGKIEGIVFKKGVTKIQGFTDGSYLAVKNKSNGYEYIVVKGRDTYSPIANKTVQKDSEPVVITVGFCTVTVYKLAPKTPKVTTGKGTITATVRCD